MCGEKGKEGNSLVLSPKKWDKICYHSGESPGLGYLKYYKLLTLLLRFLSREDYHSSLLHVSVRISLEIF